MSSDQNLIEAPKKRTGLVIAVIVVILLIIGGVIYGVTRGGGDDETVRIGVVGASDPYWEVYKNAAADQGIDVEIVDFSDYNQPNPALRDGEIDLNQFQHIVFLGEYNVAEGDDLVPIGSTAIYPLGLFSKQFDSVEEIPDGTTIAVPNDRTNQARALLVLQDAGLIELEDGGNAFSDLNDIVADGSRVEVQAFDAATTPNALDDLSAAVVNNDFVEKAGLSFDEALVTDDPNAEEQAPYINIFAARAEDKDNETYRKLVEIYHSSEGVIDGLQDVSGDTAVVKDEPADDLEQVLKDVEQDARDAQ